MPVQLYSPTSVHVDICGNIFICDTLNFRIRFVPKVSGNYFGKNNLQANYIYTIAGDGTPNVLNVPTNCITDNQGNLYFIDYNNAKICFINKTTGIMEEIFREHDFFNRNIYDLTIANNGTIYFCQYIMPFCILRKIVPSNRANDSDVAQIIYEYDMSVRDNNENLRDTQYFAQRNHICIDNTNEHMYFTDRQANIIKKINLNTMEVTNVAGNGQTGYIGISNNTTNALNFNINSPYNIAFDRNNNLYVVNELLIYKIDTNNIITVFAGSISSALITGNISPKNIKLNPSSIVFDSSNNAFISDMYSNRIYIIPNRPGRYYGRNMSSNIIYTLVGDGNTTTIGFSGDGEPAYTAYIPPVRPPRPALRPAPRPAPRPVSISTPITVARGGKRKTKKLVKYL